MIAKTNFPGEPVNNIPKFLINHINTIDPKDQYQYDPKKCRLEEIAEGLAAGWVAWDHGLPDQAVFYDVAIWGKQADVLAPRKLDKGDICPSGFYRGYDHHHTDGKRGKLGLFIDIAHTSPLPAVELAHFLKNTKTG